ncbi:DUF1963 domain-containing protein [Streptomyces sp. NPDC008343]|uniref:DUF1963 domain-containing protein n=1 Tax=Streptomyces sp. NPDC008343 TaxID=3364828 RepID=UPI0036ECF9D8
MHGLPSLPPDVPWPMREGYGALTHLASIDCAALPTEALDIDLPEDGTLVFFRYSFADVNRDADDTAEPPYYSSGRGTDPDAGMKLLYVPASATTAPRPAPKGSSVAEAGPLHLTAIYTSCLSWERTERDYLTDKDDEERCSDLAYAFDECQERSRNQIGGHERPIQGDLHSEEERWTLLASFYDLNDDVWTYWLIQPEHLAQRRFDEVFYVYQC